MTGQLIRALPLTASPGGQLSRLVRGWRERLDPDVVPGLSASGRRKRTVSQEDMGRLIDYSSHWYSRLERGDVGIYSDNFLDLTATALQLTSDERILLYLYAVGHEPSADRHPSPVRLTEPLRSLIEQQPYPTYLADEAWDIVLFNRHMADWFPWIATGTNVMRWAFTDRRARIQLHDWDTVWAPMMLAEIMAANARNPANARLAQLIHEILDYSEFARNLWFTGPIVHLHPDGDRRRLALPIHDGIVEIEVVAMAPLRAPHLRMTMLLPVGP
jgi:transcriptional regulator with XRE-family HTH domain